MKPIESVFRFIPSVMAACAVVSLYAFSQIDAIVNQTLYNYKLLFSYDWAIPYWNTAHLLLAMGGVIAGLAIAYQVYLLVPKNRVSGGEAGQPEVKEENRWSTFRLADGSTIKVKLVVKGAKRLNKYSDDGLPVYTVETEPIVQVVDVPEELKVPAR